MKNKILMGNKPMRNKIIMGNIKSRKIIGNIIIRDKIMRYEIMGNKKD